MWWENELIETCTSFFPLLQVLLRTEVDRAEINNEIPQECVNAHCASPGIERLHGLFGKGIMVFQPLTEPLGAQSAQ